MSVMVLPNAEQATSHSRIEVLLKVATAALGVMYVFGLLITNAQLMDLGISDFSSLLRIRNVMTGFAFVIYVLFFFLLVGMVALMLAAGFYILSKPLFVGNRGKVLVIVLFVVVMMEFLFSCSAGALFGFMLPWGQPWVSPFTGDVWKPKSFQSTTIPVYHQLFYAYGRAKTLWAGIITAAILIPVMYKFCAAIFPQSSPSDDNSASEIASNESSAIISRQHQLILYPMLFMATALLLFDYADGLYPNIRYNFGGGQPRIVKLDMETKDPLLVALLAARTYADSSEKGKAIVTSPVALWHQDEGFFYVSPLTDLRETPARVLACDSKTIHTIYYVAGYAKIGPGGHILSTHVTDPATPGAAPSAKQ